MAEEIASLSVQLIENEPALEPPLEGVSTISAFEECKDLVLNTLEIRPYAAQHGKKKEKWMDVIRSLNSRSR